MFKKIPFVHICSEMTRLKNENYSWDRFDRIRKEIEKDMKANNMKSVFTKEADYNNQLYIASLCAMNDKKIKEVLSYLEELSAKKFNDENNAGASI